MNATLLADIVNLAPELGEVATSWAAARYIESAGSAPGAMTARANQIIALAEQVDSAALGTTTIAQLETVGTADLAAKATSISNQVLVSGLLNVVTAALPMLPTGTWISAAGAAIADHILKQIIVVAQRYTAAA